MRTWLHIVFSWAVQGDRLLRMLSKVCAMQGNPWKIRIRKLGVVEIENVGCGMDNKSLDLSTKGKFLGIYFLIFHPVEFPELLSTNLNQHFTKYLCWVLLHRILFVTGSMFLWFCLIISRSNSASTSKDKTASGILSPFRRQSFHSPFLTTIWSPPSFLAVTLSTFKRRQDSCMLLLSEM